MLASGLRELGRCCSQRPHAGPGCPGGTIKEKALMPHYLAAGTGGYQVFHLRGTDWGGWSSPWRARSLVSLAGFIFRRKVLAADQGTPTMSGDRQGHPGGRRRLPEAPVQDDRPDRESPWPSWCSSPPPRWSTRSPVTPCSASGCPAFTGRWRSWLGPTLSGPGRAHRHEHRGAGPTSVPRPRPATARCRRRCGWPSGPAASPGLFVVGLGLLGATVIVMLAQNTATAILVGFAFGGSLLSLFMRVGGGMFTKAADVGGRPRRARWRRASPKTTPATRPPSPTTWGTTWGTAPGWAADLFESYGVILVASLILGTGAFLEHRRNRQSSAITFPLIVMGDRHPGLHHRHIRRPGHRHGPLGHGPDQPGLSFWLPSSPWWARFFVAQFYVHNLKVWWAVVVGVVLGQVRQQDHRVLHLDRDVAGARDRRVHPHRPGDHDPVRHRRGAGVVCRRHPGHHRGHCRGVDSALGGGNIQFSLYLVALIGIGLLSTTGIVVSQDTFGPVSDNAAGIAEMSGEFAGRAGDGSW